MTDKLLSLVVFIMIAFAPAAIMSGYSQGFIPGQIQPPWTPPAAVFPIAWGILYTLIGLAGWRVWNYHEKSGNIGQGYMAYVSQLILNGAWVYVFFGLNQPLWALAVIVSLIYAIYWNWRYFKELDSIAGYMLVPYLLWVIFASTLNIGIVYLN